MHNKMKLERHERMYGPHFTEECALKAVSKMHNSDGTKGAHWDIENYQQELEKCRRMLEQLNNDIPTCKQDDIIKVS